MMDLEAREARDDEARAFAEEEIAPTVAGRDREARWEPDLFRRMGERGLLGAALPGVYGGGDRSAIAVSREQSAFAEGSGDAGLALAWLAHSFGCALPILRFGTEVQRRRFLPALARGEWIGGVAHKEREGEGPTGVAVRAERRRDRWILRGEKTLVVNGAVGHVFVVTAVTDPARGKDGVSTFLVVRGARGLEIGRRIETSGLRTAVIGELSFHDCEVPEDALLGPEGTGLTHTYRLIQRYERAYLFAPWIGLMRALLDRSVAEAREHCELGRPLARSQSVRAVIADMRIRYELCRRLAAHAAFQLDHAGPSAERDIATARLYLAESVAFLTRAALSIHGPRALEAGSLAERIHRDAAAVGLVGESDDRLRSVIAGAILHLG
jgi:hypothetical protein